jgi:4-amino-4-deoxy-L-arabinose transferase-like glycosyltransferase
MSPEAPSAPSARRLWWWYAAGAAAFIPAIGFYFVGEEAIHPKAALEMWYRGEWLQQHLIGLNMQHNPLLSWIVIAACAVVGWEWMLEVARVVTIAATLATGLVLAWLALRVFGDPRFAAWTAVIYLLLEDVALYRGWLAYVDPLFGFFVFSSIACLWVACRERRTALLALAVTSLVLGFLVKAFTAFVFYGVAAFVLALDKESRRFLLGPASLAIHAAGAGAVVLWVGVLPATEGQGPRMLREILDKLGFTGLRNYLAKLVAYPVETALKTSPAALLALYYSRRRPWRGDPARAALATAAAIAVLNFLPYWLAPQSHSRYLVPIYPLAALVFARVIWTVGPEAQRVTLRWFVALLAVKLVLALAIFPYYQKVYRGENFVAVAKDILERTKGYPLHTTNDTANGLSVAAHLDILRLPAPPIAWPPQHWDAGFVIAEERDPGLGREFARYRIGGKDLFLLCRGAACGDRRER